MPIDLPPFLADAGCRRRLLITLAVLFVFRAGQAIRLPIQGADFAHALNAPIFSIGLGPVLAVLVLVEFAKLAFPALSRWERDNTRNAARFYRLMLFATFALAALRSFILVHNLEKMQTTYAIPCVGCAKYPLSAPDPVWTSAVVLSLIAGTALSVWLMRLITQYGLGNGFWVIYAALGTEGLPRSLSRCLEQWRAGNLDISTFGIGIGFFLVAIAALVAVDIPWHEPRTEPINRGRANEFQAREALAATIWPAIIASYAGSILMAFLRPSLIDLLVPVKLQIAAELVLGALLVLPYTALCYARVTSRPGSASQYEMKPVWTAALVQAAIWFGTAVMLLEVPLPFFINANSIIIFVAVAVSILKSGAAERNA